MRKYVWILALLLAVPAMAIEKQVTVKRIDVGEGEAELAIEVVAGEDLEAGETGTAHVYVSADSGESGATASQYKIITRVASQEDENRGWLGVALAMTKSVTREGDNVEVEETVKIANVVKDSPAEQAGLLQDDVVVSINGELVGSVGDLARTIGKLGPGGVANMVIERDGAPLDVAVTLASAKTGEIEWNYAPEFEVHERFRTMPHIMRLSPHGNIQTLDLSNLEGLDDSAKIIAKVMGSVDDATTEFYFGEGKRTVRIEVDRDGEVLAIEQEGDGPITVSRTLDGETTEVEYADAEELEAGDPDAFATYHEHQPRTMWIGDGKGENLDFTFEMTPGNFGPGGNFHKQLAIQLKESGQAFEEARRAMEEAKIKLDGEFNALTPRVFMQGFRATSSFRVNPDGQIELTVRKGDTEVVKVFADEADLEDRDPDAFDRYRDVMDAEIEE